MVNKNIKTKTIRRESEIEAGERDNLSMGVIWLFTPTSLFLTHTHTLVGGEGRGKHSFKFCFLIFIQFALELISVLGFVNQEIVFIVEVENKKKVPG